LSASYGENVAAGTGRGKSVAMHFLKPIPLAFAAAVALGTGCSSAPTQAPVVFARQSQTRGIAFRAGYHGVAFNACPATGMLVYVSDQVDGTVNIFAGHLGGQAPCGILNGFNDGEGLMVSSATFTQPKVRRAPASGHIIAVTRTRLRHMSTRRVAMKYRVTLRSLATDTSSPRTFSDAPVHPGRSLCGKNRLERWSRITRTPTAKRFTS